MKRKKMKFILFLNILLVLCLAGWGMAGPQGEPGCMEVNSGLFGGKCGPDVDYGLDGPAPNAGDGISDGSGFDEDPLNGPNGLSELDKGNGGPAPNSGDGIPDGSGFE